MKTLFAGLLEIPMKALFGGLIAIVLLGLYVYSVAMGILVVKCVSTPGCTSRPLSSFTDGMITALTLIGGLVSALVIAELAITRPGQTPGARMVGTREATASTRVTNTVKIVTAVYLLVWVAAGLSAFVVGYMQHPKVLQPLTDLGQSWLGLAVAAAYVYFGIKP
jgi:hypothetical protein